MRKHIERLRQQHPAVRSRFALTAATGITAVIALVWLTTLPIRFSGTLSEGNGVDATASAISAFGDTVAPNVNQIKDALAPQPTGVKGLEVVPNPQDGSVTSSQQSAQDSGNTLPAGVEGQGSTGTTGY